MSLMTSIANLWRRPAVAHGSHNLRDAERRALLASDQFLKTCAFVAPGGAQEAKAPHFAESMSSAVQAVEDKISGRKQP